MNAAPLVIGQVRATSCPICKEVQVQEVRMVGEGTPVEAPMWVVTTPCKCEGVVDTAREAS